MREVREERENEKGLFVCIQYTPTSPDFKQKFTKESLWIDEFKNPSWVITELIRKEASVSIHSEFCMGNDNIAKNINVALSVNEDFTVVEMLKYCTKHKDFQKGKILHDVIVTQGLLIRSPFIASSLINMYAKCGMLTKAKEVFNELSSPDIVSWSALIGGYAQHELNEEALNCFERMQWEGISPNDVTFICILKACGSIGAVDKGKQIHDEIASRGMLSTNIILGTALVDM